MRRSGSKVIEVKPAVQQRFINDVQRRLAGTVWQSGGCHSWYQDPRSGENAVIWPGSVVGYKLRTRSASAADYELTGKAKE
jgi:hypothetical protein